MRRFWKAIVRQFKTLDLLPDYLRSVKAEAWNLAWGPGLIAIAFCLWWSQRQTAMPTLNIVIFLGAALVLAGYYLWRADHIQLLPKLELEFNNVEPFVLNSPVLIKGNPFGYPPTHKIDLRIVVRVLPKCLSARIPACTGYLLKAYKWVDGEWMPTALDERHKLIWSNTDSTDPVDLEPGADQFLDVLYIHNVANEPRQILPSLKAIPLRAAKALDAPADTVFRLDVMVSSEAITPARISLRVQLPQKKATALETRSDAPKVEVLPPCE